jgi:hypothetical protein
MTKIPSTTEDALTDEPTLNGQVKPEDNHEPIDPYNLDDIRYAEAEYTHGDIDAEKTITAIKVRKPLGNKEWFRVHPGGDYKLSAALYERESPESATPELWLVPKPVRHLFNEKALTPVVLRLAVTSVDTVFLWAVKQPRKGLHDNYYRSLDQIVASAETNWTMIEWNNVNRVYDFWSAPDDLGDPQFPNLTMQDLLRLGFNGRAIDRLDHPIILEHQGRRA